jgi:hypothetical protein
MEAQFVAATHVFASRLNIVLPTRGPTFQFFIGSRFALAACRYLAAMPETLVVIPPVLPLRWFGLVS